MIPDKLGRPLLPAFDRSQLKAVYEVHQCADEDAPRLPPDFVHGVDRSQDWTVDESLGFPSSLEMESVAVPSADCLAEETMDNAVLTRRNAVLRVSKSSLPQFSGKF